jgi:tetratricopeptide (TPR) repeat protein
LAGRIDRLPPEEKRLLQTAAVIGTEVPFVLLQTIAELPEMDLHRGLAHLQAAEFLYEASLFPELVYTFKHALTHEVAYSGLLQERRRTLHAHIVEALEALAGEGAPLNWRPSADAVAGKGLHPASTQSRQRVGEQVERLAHHALRGEVWDKALVYSRQAGEKALARSAQREAAGYFELALSALRHLQEQHGIIELAIDLRFTLIMTLMSIGDFRSAMAYLREAEALAESLDDSRRLAQVSYSLSTHLYAMGAYDQAIASAQRALVLATASGDVVLHALLNDRLGIVYQTQGDYHRAIDCLRQTVASLDGAQCHELFGRTILPAVLSHAWLAWCHAELGMFAEGLACGEEGLRIAEAVVHPASLMVASWGIGLLALHKGDLPRALPLLERAVGICREADIPLFFPWMTAALGAAYTLGGRIADAVPLLTQAMEQTIALGMAGFQVFCSLPLGEAHLQAGRMEEAHTLAEQTLAFARERQERGNEAYALRLLGDIAARRQPPEREQAGDYYRQALVLAEELGMRPLVAHCHLGLGTLHGGMGRVEPAHAALTTAIALYRAMDMTFWLPQAEAALVQVGGAGPAEVFADLT